MFLTWILCYKVVILSITLFPEFCELQQINKPEGIVGTPKLTRSRDFLETLEMQLAKSACFLGKKSCSGLSCQVSSLVLSLVVRVRSVGSLPFGVQTERGPTALSPSVSFWQHSPPRLLTLTAHEYTQYQGGVRCHEGNSAASQACDFQTF
jgi:hypothetical protein